VNLVLLDATQARLLTDEVKHDAEALWEKLLDLYNRGAHTALGYSSWGDYFTTEFGGSRPRAYELLNAGRVIDVLSLQLQTDVLPANEAQTRELAPLLDRPDELREAWQETVAEHPQPTAADVREKVRSRMDVHYSSESPEWSTPKDLFDELDAEFRFTIDVCATRENAKVEPFFTEADDGLSKDWAHQRIWTNPPYGNGISDWVQKAYETARDNPQSTLAVCLVPARVDTAWFWDYCRHGEVRFLRGRLKFGGDANAPFPSCVVIFQQLNTSEPSVLWWER
jgi:phage N-6-adenine-methyltransferase